MTSRAYVVGLFLVSCVVLSSRVSAAVRLPSLFGDNMVLQQQSTVVVWGWAEPGEHIRVKAGWTASMVSAITGEDGRWQVNLRTAGAGGPYVVTVEGMNRIELKNVLLGEVWVCSGQSNMEYTINMLGGWDRHFAADKADLISNGYATLRLFTVTKDTAGTPRETCRGEWQVPDPEILGNFSATAFFFGRELSRTLDVPVGLISSSWGGTPAEAWTPRDKVEANGSLAFYVSNPDRRAWSPAILYNAMIHPLVRYPIRGVVWYQGESNRNDAGLYRELMRTLITGWRDVWNEGDLPFYYVQIAPYAYEEPLAAALLREAQLQTLTVPNTGMAVTADVGDVNDIHPWNKQEVGRRLALWALARTYGVGVPAYSGPLYRAAKREGNTIRVFFDHAGDGLVIRGESPGDLVIAGPDRVFVPARAKIDGATLVVSSPHVADPAAVRFAFTNTSESRLYNRSMLPASPFRTDDWPVATAMVAITAAYDSARHGVLFDLASPVSGVEIRYTLDGTEPVASSPLCEGSVGLTRSGRITARAFQHGVPSSYVARCEFEKHAALGASVTYAFPFDAKYPGGGKYGLVDGVTGSADFRDGSWQGFLGKNLDVTIDLGEEREIHEIRTGCLHNQGAWIFLPNRVEYSLSVDGSEFRTAGTVHGGLPDSTLGAVRKSFDVNLPKSVARFVRVKATSIGQCPAWHPGRGQDAWLFVGEILVF